MAELNDPSFSQNLALKNNLHASDLGRGVVFISWQRQIVTLRRVISLHKT